MNETQAPISPIRAKWKHGYPSPFLSCDCGATLDLNQESNKTKAGEAFREAHEFCCPKQGSKQN